MVGKFGCQRRLSKLVNIYANIDIALSITITFRLNSFAPLAPVPSSLPSNRSTVAFKFRVRAWNSENVPQMLAHRLRHLADNSFKILTNFSELPHPLV